MTGGRHKDVVTRYERSQEQHHTLDIPDVLYRPEALASVHPVGLVAYREDTPPLSVGEVDRLGQLHCPGYIQADVSIGLLAVRQPGEDVSHPQPSKSLYLLKGMLGRFRREYIDRLGLALANDPVVFACEWCM